MLLGVNPACVMSTVFVAASADGTERTARATRRASQVRMGKGLGLRELLLLPLPEDIGLVLTLPEQCAPSSQAEPGSSARASWRGSSEKSGASSRRAPRTATWPTQDRR